MSGLLKRCALVLTALLVSSVVAPGSAWAGKNGQHVEVCVIKDADGVKFHNAAIHGYDHLGNYRVTRAFSPRQQDFGLFWCGRPAEDIWFKGNITVYFAGTDLKAIAAKNANVPKSQPGDWYRVDSQGARKP
ncbi:hypothetical protein HPO96_06145 [Kribbella sandramycini]|uniref:Uncharacterized protein n=1 Tax=Kribbella sandramycini TaxID=60450 RepID=A0A7Y4KWD5_9ACTN|nr:hypothetical protein [Kribbella sandramycini]MBB6567577.1 hypothetical protein [Kribbella sandramycini]NOL39819.1 hypothetical protein [Kribbella sandramycini]